MSVNRDLSHTLKMKDGCSIPQLGLGTYQETPDSDILKAVATAIQIGYRHIDTAEMYNNESFVGKGVRQSGVSRKEIFITSKVWPSNFGYDKTIAACKNSLTRLGMDYLDLYLIHWPQGRDYFQSWQALIQLQKDGIVRSIGVSNFSSDQIKELADESGHLPAVNQVEFSPFNNTKKLLDYCKSQQVILEAYAPLTRGQKLDNRTINELASTYNKTAANILLRWALQHDVVIIPKSRQTHRIRENANIFDFEISAQDMILIDQLDEGFKTC